MAPSHGTVSTLRWTQKIKNKNAEHKFTLSIFITKQRIRNMHKKNLLGPENSKRKARASKINRVILFASATEAGGRGELRGRGKFVTHDVK